MPEKKYLCILEVIGQYKVSCCAFTSVSFTPTCTVCNVFVFSDQGDRMYSNTATAGAMTSDPTERVGPSCDKDDVQYASVQKHHSKAQEVPLYATVEKPQATATGNDDIAYTSVQFHPGSAATRWALLLITAHFSSVASFTENYQKKASGKQMAQSYCDITANLLQPNLHMTI